MLLLALLSTASAHLPHEMVAAAAIPPSGLDPSLPWFVSLAEEGVTSGVKRSLDGGFTFQAVNTEAMVDRLQDGAYTVDGVAAFLSPDSSRYWYTVDGTTWTSVDLPFPTEAGFSPLAGDDRLYFVSGTELYAGDPGDVPTVELSGPTFSAVYEGAAGVVALAADNGVYWRDGEAWTDLGRLPYGHPWAATSASDGVYVGTSSGDVYRWTAVGWSACGEVSWEAEAKGHTGIVRLGAGAGVLLATRAGKGISVSTDSCATWQELEPPMNIAWEEGSTYGSYTQEDQAFRWLTVVDGAYAIAGYDGVATSPDGGVTWWAPTLFSPDFARGIAFSPGFRRDGMILVPSHGGSVYRTFDGGITWDAPGVGAVQSFCQQVRIDPTVPGYTRAYSIHNRIFHRSDDQGASWTQVATPFDRAGELDVGVTGRVWASDTNSGADLPGGVVWSADGGDTWNLADALPDSFDEVTVRKVVDRGDTICVMSHDQVACSTDAGATYTVLVTRAEGEGEFWALEAWPSRGVVRALVLGTDDGIRVGTIGGGFHAAYSGHGVRQLGVSDNRVVFAGDLAGRILRSDDVGLSWRDVGVALPAQIASVVPRPDFSSFGVVLVGTMDGTYVVGNGTMERLGSYQRADSFTTYAVCPECTDRELSTASIHNVDQVPAGATYTIYMRGTSVRYVGGAVRGTSVRLVVDDAVAFDGSIAPVATGGEVLAVSGFEEGWHRFELTVTGADGITIDAVESRGEGVSLPKGRLVHPMIEPSAGGGPLADYLPLPGEAPADPALREEPGAAEPTARAGFGREGEPGAGCATGPSAGWGAVLAAVAFAARVRARTGRTLRQAGPRGQGA